MKYAAAQIQKATGGTLFEIKPVKPYPSEYRECTVQARKEIQEGVRPERAKVEDMGKYDVIFIGSPNWWSTIAPPVASFLASYDLSGKTVIPFVTHGGGGMARCGRGSEAVSQVHRSQGRRFCRGRNTDDEGRARHGSMRRFPSTNNDFMKRTIAGMAFFLACLMNLSGAQTINHDKVEMENGKNTGMWRRATDAA